MCDRCSEYDNKTKHGDPITDQIKAKHDAHLVQATKKYMYRYDADTANAYITRTGSIFQNKGK